MAADLLSTIADAAAAESPLWADAVVPAVERSGEPVFSKLADERFAVGIETIYEGYLVHYGRSRVFVTEDPDAALLLGDYLYAHGLVRIAETGDVRAVHDLAELISLCAQGRADGRDGDAAAWAATAALLGRDGLEEARDVLRRDGDASLLERAARTVADTAVDDALACHAELAAPVRTT